MADKLAAEQEVMLTTAIRSKPLNSFIASAECVWAVVRSLGLMDKMLDGMLAISQNQIRSAISLQEETTARDVPVGMDHTRLHLIDRLEELQKASAEKKVTAVDMLAGDRSFKRRWTVEGWLQQLQDQPSDCEDENDVIDDAESVQSIEDHVEELSDSEDETGSDEEDSDRSVEMVDYEDCLEEAAPIEAALTDEHEITHYDDCVEAFASEKTANDVEDAVESSEEEESSDDDEEMTDEEEYEDEELDSGDEDVINKRDTDAKYIKKFADVDKLTVPQSRNLWENPSDGDGIVNYLKMSHYQDPDEENLMDAIDVKNFESFIESGKYVWALARHLNFEDKLIDGLIKLKLERVASKKDEVETKYQKFQRAVKKMKLQSFFYSGKHVWKLIRTLQLDDVMEKEFHRLKSEGDHSLRVPVGFEHTRWRIVAHLTPKIEVLQSVIQSYGPCSLGLVKIKRVSSAWRSFKKMNKWLTELEAEDSDYEPSSKYGRGSSQF